MSLLDKFTAARRTSTPLIAISTADQHACQDMLVRHMISTFKTGTDVPYLRWDTMTGLEPAVQNDPQDKVLQKLYGIAVAAITEACKDPGSAQPGISPAALIKPADALTFIRRLPPTSVVFFHNAQHWANDADTSQGISNLREGFKLSKRMLVMLTPSIRLPAQLQYDVTVLEHTLPGETRLREIVLQQFAAARFPDPPLPLLERIAERLRGLSEFGAEQAISMAFDLRTKTVDLRALLDLKREQIRQTPGVSLYSGDETFAAIGGMTWGKGFLSRIFEGRNRPKAVVFIDEVEKSLGDGVDAHETSKDQLMTLLTWMQDHNARGVILLGPPGSGKSLISKALGNTFDVPTLALDLGAMKGSLVGESEDRIRNTMKVVDGIGGEGTFFIASCNSIGKMPPELLRRFKLGQFYMPMPMGPDLDQIWQLYMRRHEIPPQEIPTGVLYTGAEVETICELSADLGMSLQEAADTITPLAVSNPAAISSLSQFCDGRYRSLATGGYHRHAELQALLSPAGQTLTGGRQYDVE